MKKGLFDFAKTPVGAYHRSFIQSQQSNTLNGDEDHMPTYTKYEFAGRVKSQMGDRAKYQRLIQKRKQAHADVRVNSNDPKPVRLKAALNTDGMKTMPGNIH